MVGCLQLMDMVMRSVSFINKTCITQPRDCLLVAKMKYTKLLPTHINHITYIPYVLWSVHLLIDRKRVIPNPAWETGYLVLQDTTYFSVFPIKGVLLFACLFVAMVRTESIHTIKAAAYHINHTVVGSPPHWLQKRAIHFLNGSNDKARM